MERVAADADEPHKISLTSSIRLVDTPAKYISIMASSTPVSRRMQRSTIAAARCMPLSFGILSVTWPEVVGLLLEKGVQSVLDGLADEFFELAGMAASSNDTMRSNMVLSPGMIEFDARIIPKAGAVSFCA